MNSQFNAIDYAQQLEAAGVPQAQADVHAKMLSLAITNCAASKGDLAALDANFTARMDAFETRLVARLDVFEAGVKLALTEMRVEIEQIRGEVRMLRWMCATNAVMLIAIIVKIYFP